MAYLSELAFWGIFLWSCKHFFLSSRRTAYYSSYHWVFSGFLSFIFFSFTHFCYSFFQRFTQMCHWRFDDFVNGISWGSVLYSDWCFFIYCIV
ncbi:hypothetical protein EX30DRAFT_185359 [Ascodesmis nigricans]|uniref:Uncharacterized protein n=1 Tax=Ascodesmis nigricans TaxID=341454 RepID=A0A4S2N0H5_9PEZI|nr:hypothetical protein EX30DRAFT_185359 [Ascodesmis nigricans]